MSESTTSSDTGTHQRTQTHGSSGTASPLSTAVRYVRRAASSGLLAGATAAANLVRASRALRDGSARKAARYGMMGGFWLAVAVVQRRSRRGRSGGTERSGTVDQTGVVDTAPDVESVSSGSEPDASGEGTSIEVTDANPAPDVEDVEDAGTAGSTDGVEDVDEAEGVEDARDADGMEDVDEAEGVTDVENTDEGEDESDD